MAINTKDLHKICGKLREDRFLTVCVALLTEPSDVRRLTMGQTYQARVP